MSKVVSSNVRDGFGGTKVATVVMDDGRQGKGEVGGLSSPFFCSDGETYLEESALAGAIKDATSKEVSDKK